MSATPPAERIAPLAACIAAAPTVLLPIAARLTAIADPHFNHPCIDYQSGQTPMWPLPIAAIGLA